MGRNAEPKPIWQKPAVRKGLLLLGSVMAGLLLGELLLRGWACKNARSLRPMWSAAVPAASPWRPDPVRNHARKPGVQFIMSGDPPGLEYCTWTRISAQGLNDDPVQVPKPPGEFRILVLGDSFVEATEVARAENFCQQLERLLTARQPRKVRVINAGVSTYSPLLEYLYFTRELVQYEPDVVVQAFFANDVFDDMRYTQVAQLDGQGLPVAVPPRDEWLVLDRGQPREESNRQQWAFRHPVSESSPWLARQFYLAALVRHGLAVWRLKRAGTTPPVNDEFFILEDSPNLAKAQQEGWELTRRYIGLLKAACDRAGARFFLSSAPIASQVYGHTTYDHFFFKGRPTDADQAHLREIAAELQVPFLDLLTPLRTAGEGLYYPRDGHWTPKGHRVVAEALAPMFATVVAQAHTSSSACPTPR
jgi:lysophospholipase L1-like esterase